MKKMSCFCASNTSGESVYSGYLRWRMGLPLPPIPKEDQSQVLRNTNKMIFEDIDGVKNVNDLTVDESDCDEDTLKRFRRRKRNESLKSELDPNSGPLNSSKSKHFRENPLYKSSLSNDEIGIITLSQIPIDEENNVPCANESFNSNNNFSNIADINRAHNVTTQSAFFNNIPNNNNLLPTNQTVSSFLVNRYLENVHEYNDACMVYSSENDDTIYQPQESPKSPAKLQQQVDEIVSSLVDHSQQRRLPILSSITPPFSPPPPPPHRKPSTIFEESDESMSRTSYLSSNLDNIDNDQEENDDGDDEDNNGDGIDIDTIQNIKYFDFQVDASSNISMTSINKIVDDNENVKVDDNVNEIHGTNAMDVLSISTITSTSIPIFSIKHGDIDKIISEHCPTEYDYAYNKSWSKGVEMNLSLNLSEDKRNKLKRVHQSNKENQLPQTNSQKSTTNNAKISSQKLDPLSVITEDKTNQISDKLNVNQKSEDNEQLIVDDDDNNTIENCSESSDEATTMEAKGLPKMSPVPPFTLLKLSSIEADAISNDSQQSLSPKQPVMGKQLKQSFPNNNINNNNNINKIPSRNSNFSGGSITESIETNDSISRNESWDVLQGQFVKELTATRFIDPSIINNNTQSSPTANMQPVVTTNFSSHHSSVSHFTNSKSWTPILSSNNHHMNINNNNNSNNNRTIQPDQPCRLMETTKRFFVNINPNIALDKQPWYHFYLTRFYAETLLQIAPDGSFLVRRSESNNNDYSLSIRHKSLYLHMKITKTHRGFILGEYSQPYQSIPHMLYHYCLTMVPVKGAEAACLRYAITREDMKPTYIKNNSNRSNNPFSTSSHNIFHNGGKI